MRANNDNKRLKHNLRNAHPTLMDSSPEVECTGDVLIPLKIFKRCISSSMLEHWNGEWESHKECRQTKKFAPSVSQSASRALTGLTRERLCLVIQVLTGHAFLRYHMSLTGVARSGRCRFCDNARTNEESWHLINECPFFEVTRNSLRRVSTFPLVLSSPNEVDTLSDFLEESHIDRILTPQGVEQNMPILKDQELGEASDTVSAPS